MGEQVNRVPYDEFGLFHENAAEYGLPFEQPPAVRRASVEVGPGRALSALVWGESPPELVLLHGGAQNAHTWDTLALALDRPLVAIDLPGHGHSGAPRRGTGDVGAHAEDVALAVQSLAPDTRAVVGMSLGGLTALALAQLRRDLVPRLVLVDVTPGVDERKAAPILAFVNGPESFADFDEILSRTIEFNPTRSVSSLRRGILHNAVQRDDGSWVWRYARFRGAEAAPEAGSQGAGAPDVEFGNLWEAAAAYNGPIMLVRGMAEGSVVSDEDEAELRRRGQHVRIERVEGAGHSVQGDQPLALARLLQDFVG